MSIPADVYHPQDEKAILPFNPPGTFAPGTFAPGSIAPGAVTVLAPSYPLQPRANVAGGDAQRHVSYMLPPGAAQSMATANGVQHQQLYPQPPADVAGSDTQRPVSHALPPGAVPSVVVANGVQHQQLYPQAAFPPQAVVAHPRSASIPTMGDPNAAGLQTYSVTTYYTAQGVPVQSQASMVPAEHLSIDTQPLVQTTIPQQAITVEPRHPMPPSGHLGSAEPHSNVQFDRRALSPQPPGHVQSPSWSSATPTIVGCSPLLDRQLLYPNRTPPRRCKQLRKCPTHRPKLTWPQNRSPLRLLIKTSKSLL
jgi:hypothetical protein